MITARSAFTWLTLGMLGVFLAELPATAEKFRVATYNVENYMDQPTQTRRLKPEHAKAQVRDNILAVQPDVIAIQEMGRRSALTELQSSLKAGGLDLPYAEWMQGWDTNIHLAILSRFPFSSRTPHMKKAYLLDGRRLNVSRGFAEVEVTVNENYAFTLITGHLKSKRPVSVADQAEMRNEEARILRGIVDDRLAANENVNLVVCGDLNDFFTSDPVKTVIGRGKSKLIDTRPAEQNGDDQPHPTNSRYNPRNVTWTHHYGAEDTYGRIDYILLSPGMENEWVESETYALKKPNWGVGSDHRPIVATFDTELD